MLSQLGIGGQCGNMSPDPLGSLAEHVASNHPGVLSQVLGSALGGSGGGSSRLLHGY